MKCNSEALLESSVRMLMQAGNIEEQLSFHLVIAIQNICYAGR